MKKVINFNLIVLAIFFSITLCEFTLFYFKFYENLVNKKNVILSNTIYEPKINKIENFVHPDLKHPVQIKYNNLGYRDNVDYKISENNKNNFIIGVYGDSFTEAKRSKYEYTPTEFLNKFYKDKKFLNFGVDGFGIEQSYQRYENFKKKINQTHVIYIFCSNDYLDDFDRYQLFNYKLKNDFYEITNIYESPDKSKYFSFFKKISNYRTTYLFLDTFYTIKHFFNYQEITINDQDSIYNSLVNKLFIFKKDKEKITKRDKFLTILNKWNESVNKINAKFYILILFKDIDRMILKEILKKNYYDFNIIDSNEYIDLKNYKKLSLKFKNDGHLNEIGNLALSESINNFFKGENFNYYRKQEINKIKNYYNNYGKILH